MVTTVEMLKDLERSRLRALVEVDAAVLDALHSPDFVLVTPSGGTWSKEHYIGGILSGMIDYRRLEAVSEMDAMLGANVAVLRYQSAIDIHVLGQEAGPLTCWHMDSYRRATEDSPWRVVWSQATEIPPAK